MIIEREQFRPNDGNMNLIEACLDKIRPSSAALTDWFNTYASNQKRRIAFDLDIVLKSVLPKSAILEFGSIPLLLTAALKKLEYRVTGIDIG